MARALYQHSTRAHRPFVVVNCVAIPESLLESELFGYEPGAFTGASGRRLGKVEHAQGGTLFLDEIGDMPSGVQAKLLRLLQDKTIERLGGAKPIPVDVRIVAATNRDLETAITVGKFPGGFVLPPECGAACPAAAQGRGGRTSRFWPSIFWPATPEAWRCAVRASPPRLRSF